MKIVVHTDDKKFPKNNVKAQQEYIQSHSKLNGKWQSGEIWEDVAKGVLKEGGLQPGDLIWPDPGPKDSKTKRGLMYHMTVYEGKDADGEYYGYDASLDAGGTSPGHGPVRHEIDLRAYAMWGRPK